MAYQRCSVIVIGAGPYGLSAAAHLLANGVDVALLGSTMASWRDGMPAGMILKSTPDASNISAPSPDARLADFLVNSGEPPLVDNDKPSLRQFVDYGAWFERRFVAGVHENALVESLDRSSSGFVAHLDTGERLTAATVVLATGHRPHAHVPGELGNVAAAGADLVSHSSAHADLSKFAGRSVAVIGAGQSALETAAILGEVGARPVLLARRPGIDWDLPPRKATRYGELLRPTSGIGPGWPKRMLEKHAELVRHLPLSTRMMLLREVLGPSGAYWLRDRFEAQAIPVHLGTSLQSSQAHNGQARLDLASAAGESTIDVDHVIAATGYRFDVDRIAFLSPSLRQEIARINGFPRLSGNFESSVPGLYFTGLAAGATFGPLLRFVCGTHFASPHLAKVIARSAPRRGTAKVLADSTARAASHWLA
jgi:thioredoxin reductase